MKDPGTRIVGLEADRGIVSCETKTYDVALHGIHIVIDRTPGASNNRERMLR